MIKNSWNFWSAANLRNRTGSFINQVQNTGGNCVVVDQSKNVALSFARFQNLIKNSNIRYLKNRNRYYIKPCVKRQEAANMRLQLKKTKIFNEKVSLVKELLRSFLY